MVRKIFVFAAAMVCSGSAFAFDFTSANALFNNRANGPQAIRSARAVYEAALPNLSGYDYIYAVEQMARLDYFEGTLLGEEGNTEARKVAYGRCMSTADLVAPSATVAANPIYYYWKGSCLAQWAKANGIIASLSRSGELLDYLNRGEQIDPTYEGGGFYRVKGAVYAKLPAINPFGPRRDLAQSRTLLQRAIESPAYARTTNPDTESGQFHYNNYQYLAETLIIQGDRPHARQVIQDALDNIDAGYVSPLRQPETAQTRDALQALLNDL